MRVTSKSSNYIIKAITQHSLTTPVAFRLEISAMASNKAEFMNGNAHKISN